MEWLYKMLALPVAEGAGTAKEASEMQQSHDSLLLLIQWAGMWYMTDFFMFHLCSYLDGVLELLLEVMGDVIAVGNVPDARQRHTGCESLSKAWQPVQIRHDILRTSNRV